MEKLGYEEMEEQILLLLDNELTAEQSEKVWALIDTFPEYRALYEDYAAVYLEADEFVETPDLSYLKKEEKTAVSVPMRPMRTHKPLWGVAASVAIVVTLSVLFWNDGAQEHHLQDSLTKSDKLHQLTESPIKVLERDSLDKQQETLKQKENKPATKDRTVRAAHESRLAVQHEDVIPKEGRYIETDLAKGFSDDLQLIAVKAPRPKESYRAATAALAYAHSAPVGEKDPGDHDSKGLLPEMIKAGQWIFGDHKQGTTVEFAIGNNENRKFKIKL